MSACIGDGLRYSQSLYVEIQIIDFIDRLRTALGKSQQIIRFTAGQLFKPALGKAVVLDHDINRPGFVKDDIGKALDTFFIQNLTVSKDISFWGSAYGTNERKVLDIYGPGRRMTNASMRYNHLKAEL